MAAGDVVTCGQALVVMEAMKMEHVVTAPFDGSIEILGVALGDQVRSGDLLMRVVDFAHPRS